MGPEGMSGRVTRISLDAASEAGRTDWARLRSLSDEEIEAAVRCDPDSYLLEEGEHLGRKGASYRYLIHVDISGEWRWRLLSANGETLAVGAKSFPSRDAVKAAIGQLRAALLGARSEAA